MEKNAPVRIPQRMLDVTDPAYRRRALDEGPHANQLWIAEDHDDTEFLMIVDVDERDPRIVHVIPMSNDPGEQTADGLVVGRTPIGLPMIAWPALAIPIPIRVLDVPLGDFDARIAQAVAGDDPDLDPHVHRAQDSEDFLAAYALVSARARVFQQWWNIGRHLPPLHQEEAIVFGISEERRAYAEALKTVLGLSATQRNAIMNHGMPLTKTQAKKMGQAGFAAEPPQAQEAIPDAYLIAAEQPRWRQVLDDMDIDGDDVRLELARKAAFDLAARTSGHDDAAVNGALLKAVESMKSGQNGQRGQRGQ
ncbi:hypothetical protein CGZ88_0378 [Bifidobacterium anseris]|uniref:Uncharacterized protein n=1 Tax=Bifidobacterium anseris TaxID=2020963 RepID=A0A2N5J1Z1_9BIFI|nr:hypothetical protein [Bifidobacterium anseris]PLS28216.1 hypothetical protein CGZ88_0378 [Bifidobacterium anseris]